MVGRLLIASSALLALGACGDTSASEDSGIEVRSAEQNRLFELSAIDRDITMRRAILAAGYPCDRVERSGFVAKYENTDMWTATCSDTRRWAIFVGADDSAQVRYCPDVEATEGLPACEITQLDTEGIEPELTPVEPGSNEPYPEEGNSESSAN
ncbi:hypothetical protein [Sphingomicrobium sediminis]|uniref:Uncharacterized protein n=1 Tax=Sphingomicrobium sediminis TaxID=2950949 RepID=A0A9X2J5J7_9SPHN|nr:hypothetical protein [Sphingomicrobium sediminis]MCM8558312.1 hypothetical protein [Sphingomicrobium sediminis]